MKERTLFATFQKRIDNFIKNHGGYWSPLSMLSAVVEELGELAREINHLEGFKPKKSINEGGRLGEEIADLLFSIICIANYYNIDLNEETNKIFEKYKKRDLNRFI